MPIISTPDHVLMETACNAPMTLPEKQAGDILPRFNHCKVSQDLSINSVTLGALRQNIDQADQCRKRKITCILEGSDYSSAKKMCSTREHNNPVIKSEDDQCLPTNPLFLEDNSPHGRFFNELVHTIEQARQSQILAKLHSVQELTHLTGKHLPFFSSEDFPNSTSGIQGGGNQSECVFYTGQRTRCLPEKHHL